VSLPPDADPGQAGAMKEDLLRRLRSLRADLRSKLDGLDEYQVRRPLTPTGSNLLGLVKHVASVELGYFTGVFGRDPGRELPWYAAEAEDDADLWVPAEESRQSVIELHEYSARRSDETIAELALDAPGVVPWWPEERRRVTLHQVFVHVLIETARHAGHADILRELLDGRAGMGPGDANLTPRSGPEWESHVARVEAAARAAAGTDA
jgi:glucose-6-phosphate dehydrogenase assembly protein OpcA